jgi:hypothetical protein
MLPSVELILALFVLVNAGLIFAYSTGNVSARPGLALFYLSLLAAAVFLQLGKPHQVLPQKPEFYSEIPPTPKRVYFNWGEVFPHYINAKYMPELGYKGLYDAIALADSESTHPAITVTHIHNLQEPYEKIPLYDAKTRAERDVRPNFKDERWAEFKRDYGYFKNLAFAGWMDEALQRHGIHAPPTWMIMAHNIANKLPVAGNWPYAAWLLGDGREPVELLAMLDIALMGLAFLFLWWGFGLASASAFILLSCLSYFTPVAVSGGAFLRFDWLFGLAAGLAAFKRNRCFLAGFMLAFATAMRVFPGIFLLAGLFALLMQRTLGREPSLAPMGKYMLGSLVSGGLLFALSIQGLGTTPWLDFRDRTVLHLEAAYIDNIGLRATQTYIAKPELRSFKEESNVEKFRDHSHAIRGYWKDNIIILYAMLAAVIIGSLWAARQVPTYEGVMLMSGLILITYFTPAHYYWAFLALIPAVLYQPNLAGKRPKLLISLFFIYWIAAYLSPRFISDDLLRSVVLGCGLAVYFLIWMVVNCFLKGYSGEAPTSSA